MRESLNSSEAFVARLEKLALLTSPEKYEAACTVALTALCEFLEKKAKEKFGVYQKGWAELADATKKDRRAKGFPENEPLLRTGDLRDSIKFTVEGLRAFLGSTSEIMVYQEKGTVRTGWGKGIPPRPVFLLTQMEEGAEAVSIFFRAFIKSLFGRAT